MAKDEASVASRNLTSDRRWIIELYDEHGSFERFESLSVRAMRLVVAAAAFARIRSLFEAIHGTNWEGGTRAGEKEEGHLYQFLRRTVLSSLENEPTFAIVLAQINSVLSKPLPSGYGNNGEWEHAGRPAFVKIQDAFAELGAYEHVDPSEPETSAFLSAQDVPFNHLETLFRVAYEAWRNKLSTLSPDEPPTSAAASTDVGSVATRHGRRAIDLDYETAARVWWELIDDYQNSAEIRGPSQEELCERLTSLGIPIRPRTLRRLIKKWREAGCKWPPPEELSGQN